ncbi:hypothetical protein [Methanosarcina sp.]|uniref:hypothetical protein n=1 Tax=Methanosarcina sp. TaxID=2213 RepID=UPI00399AF34F
MHYLRVRLKLKLLGSCVSITLYYRRKRVGGLVHTMLPSISHARIKDNPLKYTDSGIELTFRRCPYNFHNFSRYRFFWELDIMSEENILKISYVFRHFYLQ